MVAASRSRTEGSRNATQRTGAASAGEAARANAGRRLARIDSGSCSLVIIAASTAAAIGAQRLRGDDAGSDGSLVVKRGVDGLGASIAVEVALEQHRRFVRRTLFDRIAPHVVEQRREQIGRAQPRKPSRTRSSTPLTISFPRAAHVPGQVSAPAQALRDPSSFAGGPLEFLAVEHPVGARFGRAGAWPRRSSARGRRGRRDCRGISDGDRRSSNSSRQSGLAGPSELFEHIAPVEDLHAAQHRSAADAYDPFRSRTPPTSTLQRSSPRRALHEAEITSRRRARSENVANCARQTSSPRQPLTSESSAPGHDARRIAAHAGTTTNAPHQRPALLQIDHRRATSARR